MCRDHHQPYELVLDINRIHEEKYHPCPRRVVLSSATLLPSLQHKLVRILCCTLSSLLPSIVLLYLEILPPFMSRMSWEFHHLLRTLSMVIPFAITILSWVLVLVPTGVPTSESCCLDSALLATLLL